MADFQLSLVNSLTSLPDITAEGGVMTVVDHSNYDDASPEAGHARANFTDLYKIRIRLPNADVVLYSSIGDGDYTITTPSAGDPTIDYTYALGDGIYWVDVYTVPTYDAAAAYLISTTPHVYYGGSIWQALTDSTGITPVEGTNWHEITDVEDLPTKYKVNQRVVIISDAKRCFARRVYNANTVNNLIGVNWEKLTKDPEWLDAMRLYTSITAISVLMAAGRWTEVETNINFCKQITSKYETL